MPDKISRILNDRESGSVALLKHLISALEEELKDPDLDANDFYTRVAIIREKLNHFAAIENFLASLNKHSRQKKTFAEDVLLFISDYRIYWQDSAGKIAENFLQHCNPEGLCILTHSHSETVISLLGQLHARQIPFQVIQTLSTPGQEGRKSFERMLQLNIRADLIDEVNIQEAMDRADLLFMGCDALLAAEFLNKAGTRIILEQARLFNKRSFLVTESRKEISNPGWKSGLKEQALFEWVPLNLIDVIVTEKRF